VQDPSIFASLEDMTQVIRHMSNPDVRKEFGSIFTLLAEIDVAVALAMKFKELESKQMPVCFVDYITDSSKPIIEIEAYWHPLLDPAKAVCNSVALNTDVARCLLITGPNTGGKSTNMKGIILNILFAQSFGIAFAKKMRLTPFHAIETYLNVTEDLAKGHSTFEAQARRAIDLHARLKNLPKDQFGFVLIDEIFTGTSPDQTEMLAYQFTESLSRFENVIFVSATHFPKLTELEKLTQGRVKNYSVGLNRDAQGKITGYTYTLVPGISKDKNASDIVEKLGLTF
jgi:DNA mismatch repair ATPase MutS